jgi:gluconokinase
MRSSVPFSAETARVLLKLDHQSSSSSLPTTQPQHFFTMDVILALDIGSSSIRCVAYSLTEGTSSVSAVPGCSSSIPARSVRPNTGKIQWKSSGNETVLDKVDSCVESVLKSLRKNKTSFRVVAVGFSSFVMNLIAVDKDGNVLGDDLTMSYACNAPAVAKECQAIRNELGPEGLEQLYQNTGAPIHSAYALPQLRELYHSRPDQAQPIFKWQTIASLCLSRWTGTKTLPISYSEASWTGLLNFRDCAYDYTATELLPKGCLGTLPALADFTDSIPGIPEYASLDFKQHSNPYWSKWPELRDTPLFLGVGDGVCANIGSKCSTASRIAVTIGTSAAARVCLQQGIGCSIQVPSGLFCYRVDQYHVLMGGALTDGGSVIEWAAELLNLSTEEAFLNVVNRIEQLTMIDYATSSSSSSSITDTGVTMIPFLSGERSTGFRDGATGAIMGLTRNTTSTHFFKACLESVSLRLRAILELIVQAQGGEHDAPPPRIVASGNALESNALWRQMIADSSGLEVLLDLETVEGTSRGVARLVAAALAAAAGNKNETTSDFLSEEEIHSCKFSKPRARAHAYFNQAAKSQETFLDAMSPLYMQD